MISRKVLISILVSVVLVFIITWKIGRIPAYVVVINQSGTTLQRVALETDSGRIDLGDLNNAETRRVSVDPTAMVRLRYSDRGWTSPEGLSAGQSVVLYVMPDGRVEARRKLGTLAR